ncbi:hypothetical protein JL721_7050 [Aureococcus anophagefferens]|nr:hypothetical protein JL721_7050 [Aureococcus anophagefferens]
MDPDHEPFALVDLFMSPHRPLVPVWVNNVVSITVYAGALALFFLVLLQTGAETYRETEISQHVMTGGGPGSRTGKRDVACRCLSKLTASLDLEDPVLADGGSWRVVSDIALPGAANCERQFADLPVEDAHVVAYDGARGDAYGFCYSAAANRTRVGQRPTGQGQGQGQGVGQGVGQGAPGGGGGGGCYDNATAAVAAWNDARVFASFCREFEDHPPYICSWYRYYGYARVLSIAHGSVDFLLVEAMADPEPPRTAQPGGDLAVTVAQLRRDLDETRRLLDEVRRDPRLAATPALPPIKGRPRETKEGQDAELSDASRASARCRRPRSTPRLLGGKGGCDRNAVVLESRCAERDVVVESAPPPTSARAAAGRLGAPPSTAAARRRGSSRAAAPPRGADHRLDPGF